MKSRFIALAVLLGGCPASKGPASDAEATPEQAPDDEPEGEGEAAADRVYVGVIVPAASVDISSSVGGKLEELPIPVGEKVLEGDVIAKLANKDLRHQLKLAKAGVNSARSNLNKSRTERNRAKEKASQAEKLGDIVSKEERKDAEFEAKRSEAAEGSVKGQLGQRRAEVARLQAQVDALTVRADFAGVVAAHYESPGQILSAERRIIRLISDETLLRFAVPHAEASAFAVGNTLSFTADGGGKEIVATIKGIAPEVDAASMVLIEATLGDPAATRAGVSGRVRLSR